MPDHVASSEVWLVGAGPGDPDLLTRKAERLIRAADVVFYDALIDHRVLDLIPEDTRCVSVGKRSGRHSKSQSEINDLLLAAAQSGARVVRLKGGDPAIFGRAAEEIDHLAAHNIRVRVCPGITAASAAAAAAGLSLTLRGQARRLTFVTAHVREGVLSGIDWQALADPQATLAIYMGKAGARQVSQGLITAGLAADTPVLLASAVSTANESILGTTLALLPLAAACIPANSPALILVGDAVRRQPAQVAAAAFAAHRLDR